MNEVLQVFEINDGQWTHSLALDDESWSKGEAIRRASKLANLNGMELFVDFPKESKIRAKELGIDLYAKPQRSSKTSKLSYFKPERFDPFA